MNLFRSALIYTLSAFLAFPAYAADNAVTLTAGSGVTMRTKDIGAGVQSPFNILGDTSGASIYGTAGSANANVITVQGIASGTPQPVTLTSTTITGTVAVTQSTSPWIVAGGGTAGNAGSAVLTVQGIASMTPITTNISGSTFTSGNFNVQCANCSGSGVSTTDAATFTASSSLFAGGGGFFQTTATSNPLTTGKQGMFQVTANRALFTNLRDASGTEIGTSAAEVFVGGRGTAGSAAGGVLTVQGSASGTAIPVTLTSTTITGTVAATQSGTWTVQPGNTANSTPWLVTAASATAPVVTMNSASANGGMNSAVAAVFDDAAPTSITENSFGFLRMSANRNLYDTIRDAAGNERGANVDASNRLTTAPTIVSGAVASGAYASGSIASGAIASGAVASGAYASGALASGSIASGAMVDLLTVIGTKAAGTAATNSLLTGGVFNSSAPTLTNGQQAALQVTSAGSLHTTVDNTNANGQATAANSSPVVLASDKNVSLTEYPIGATAIISSNTGTTAAITAGFAAVSGVTNYICGLSIRANATAAATGNSTVAGISPATMNFTQWTAPLASGIGVTEMVFPKCLPSSSTNTAITVTSAAPGSGGVISATAWGYKL